MNQNNIGPDLGMFENLINSGIGSNKEIIVNKLIFTPTRVYSDMHRRSMSIEMNSNGLSNMAKLLDNSLSRDTSVTPETVSRYIPMAARLGDTLGDRIGIVNGWNNKRFMFLLDVSVIDKTEAHVEYKSYIQGYTDIADLSINGNMSDDMMLVVNSVVNLSKTQLPGMAVPRIHVTSCFNVITGNELQLDRNMMNLITPSALVGTLSQESLNTMFNGAEVTGINDNVSLGTSEVRTSSRVNNIGSNYMASLINGKIASTSNEFNNGDQYSQNYTLARALSKYETHINEVEFFKALAMVTGTSEKFTSAFKLGILKEMDPSLNNDSVSMSKIVFFNRKDIDRQRNDVIHKVNQNMGLMNANPLTAEDTEDLRRTDVITTKAIETIEHIASLAGSQFITQVVFDFTNMTVTGQPSITMHDLKSFIPETDKIAQWRMFSERFINESIPTLTHSNNYPFSILVECNIVGESTVAINMGDGQVVYRIPSFCDSLHSSLIGDTNHLSNLSKNMKSAFSIVQSATIDINSGKAVSQATNGYSQPNTQNNYGNHGLRNPIG